MWSSSIANVTSIEVIHVQVQPKMKSMMTYIISQFLEQKRYQPDQAQTNGTTTEVEYYNKSIYILQSFVVFNKIFTGFCIGDLQMRIGKFPLLHARYPGKITLEWPFRIHLDGSNTLFTPDLSWGIIFHGVHHHRANCLKCFDSETSFMASSTNCARLEESRLDSKETAASSEFRVDVQTSSAIANQITC